MLTKWSVVGLNIDTFKTCRSHREVLYAWLGSNTPLPCTTWYLQSSVLFRQSFTGAIMNKEIKSRLLVFLPLTCFILLLNNWVDSVSPRQKTSLESISSGHFSHISDSNCPCPRRTGILDAAPEWGVLLTMCFRRDSVKSEDEHEAVYRGIIEKWLQHTGLPIFVIETSGFQLNITHERLWYFTFDDPHRKKVGSSSILEANALNRAMEEMNSLPAANITHVLKVTGRYFLEGVEEQLSKHADLRSPVLLLQTHRNEDIKWQNSEYFGISLDALDLLSHRVLQSNKAMEENLFTLSNLFGFKFLGPGFTNSQPRGGDGLVINPL